MHRDFQWLTRVRVPLGGSKAQPVTQEIELKGLVDIVEKGFERLIGSRDLVKILVRMDESFGLIWQPVRLHR